MKMPEEVKNLINHYFNLKIGGKVIKTPYFINKKHTRGGELRSLVGKGTPHEIEDEVKIYAKLRGFNLKKASENEIRKFMKQEGIGIDCSGLISHILNTWLKVNKPKGLYSNLTFNNKNFFDKVVKYLRPMQNISANLLTNKENSIPIELKNIKVGDLLRLKGLKHGHHIAIIIKITKKDDKKTIEYLHSTPHYGAENGIKIGEIVIKDENKDIGKQKWLEFDKKNICWTLTQYLKDENDNGIRRPKFFDKKI